MKTKLILWQANDQIIQLTGIVDADGNTVSNATITGILTDRSGASVPSFPSQPFTPDGTTAGAYDLTVPSSFAPGTGAYTLELDGHTPNGTFQVFVATEVQKRDP